ncbi:MAG: methyltransferase, partial [Burkholderiales bacterium]|nr:methyltransferase [Burkholderiales bacterium]
GYQLVRHHTAVNNWFDEKEVLRIGYPETEALLKKVTGCSKVVVFDHTPRVDDEAERVKRNLRPPA